MIHKKKQDDSYYAYLANKKQLYIKVYKLEEKTDIFQMNSLNELVQLIQGYLTNVKELNTNETFY